MTSLMMRIHGPYSMAIACAALLWPTPSRSQPGQVVEFCIGEHSHVCPKDSQHYPCGQGVEAVAQDICTLRGPGGPKKLNYFLSLVLQQPGGKCGYNVARVTCQAQ